MLTIWDGTLKAGAEPSRAEPSRAEPSRAEPSRAEPSRAEPSMMRGRTRLARLLSAPAFLFIGVLLPLASAPAQAQVTCTTTDPAVVGHSGGSGTSDAAARAADCTAMLRFKDTLRGTGALNWARTLDMFSWDGVILSDEDGDLLTTDDKNRVAEISLYNRSLNGTIPGGLSALTGLTKLEIWSDQLTHQLTGGIPDLSALTSLQRLNLRKNKLSGSIAAAHLPASLIHLDLTDNEFTGDLRPERPHEPR